MPRRLAESMFVLPIFLCGSFGFSFSKTAQVFWMQPQLAEGFCDKTCGHMSDFDVEAGFRRLLHPQEAPADSGHPFAINHAQSWSVWQEMAGFCECGVGETLVCAFLGPPVLFPLPVIFVGLDGEVGVGIGVVVALDCAGEDVGVEVLFPVVLPPPLVEVDVVNLPLYIVPP